MTRKRAPDVIVAAMFSASLICSCGSPGGTSSAPVPSGAGASNYGQSDATRAGSSPSTKVGAGPTANATVPQTINSAQNSDKS